MSASTSASAGVLVDSPELSRDDLWLDVDEDSCLLLVTSVQPEPCWLLFDPDFGGVGTCEGGRGG